MWVNVHNSHDVILNMLVKVVSNHNRRNKALVLLFCGHHLNVCVWGNIYNTHDIILNMLIKFINNHNKWNKMWV